MALTKTACTDAYLYIAGPILCLFGHMANNRDVKYCPKKTSFSMYYISMKSHLRPTCHRKCSMLLRTCITRAAQRNVRTLPITVKIRRAFLGTSYAGRRSWQCLRNGRNKSKTCQLSHIQKSPYNCSKSTDPIADSNRINLY